MANISVSHSSKFKNTRRASTASARAALFDLARVLGVPVQFFYDEAPLGAHAASVQMPGFAETQPGESYVVDFLGTREGLELNKAFARITEPKVRRSIVDLVRALVSEES